jgi:hypothetical protein
MYILSDWGPPSPSPASECRRDREWEDRVGEQFVERERGWGWGEGSQIIWQHRISGTLLYKCTYTYTLLSLKGQCHEIFCFLFFSWISFPPAPEYHIRTVLNFSKIRGDIRKSRCTTGINDTGGKFAAGVVLPLFSLVLLIPVSMTSVANNGNNIRLLRP